MDPLVVERILDRPPEGGLAGKVRDALPARFEERRWGRRLCRTAAGREVALCLPTGTLLPPGALLYVGDDWYLEVEALPEPLLAAAPRSREEALRLAFEVGNRHFSLALDGDRLLVLDDPAMEQLLGRLGVPYVRTDEVFCPIGGGHRHGH